MHQLSDFIHDPTVLAIATLIGAAAIIWAIITFPVRWWLNRGKPRPATTVDIGAVAQQIKDLENKLDRGSEWVDGLPQAVNEKLRAAYQEARILQLEGYEAQSADKHRDAIDRFTRALVLAETDSQRAALRILRGNSYESVSDYGKAEADYKEVLKVAARISPDRDALTARAVVLSNLGITYAARGELGKAEKHQKEAVTIHRETGDRLGEAGALCNLGGVYLRQGKLHEAEEHFKKALKIQRKISNRHGEAQNLGNLGSVYILRGELGKAEKNLERALNMDGNRLGQAQDLLGLGNVYYQRGRLELAEKAYKQALNIDSEIGNRLGQAQDLLGLGNVYHQRAQSERAEKRYTQALEIAEQIAYRLGQADALGNLGIVYGQRGELGKAKEHLRQAHSIYNAIGAGGQGPRTVWQTLEGLVELDRQGREGGGERSEG